MKYNIKSAEVLNEADRFEGILNWTLFTHEQDARLFGEDPKETWFPGRPLYSNPRTIAPYDSVGGEFNTWDGYWGNTIRPMIEEFEDGENHMPMRCEPCGVSWNTGDECWVCGKTRPWQDDYMYFYPDPGSPRLLRPDYVIFDEANSPYSRHPEMISVDSWREMWSRNSSLPENYREYIRAEIEQSQMYVEYAALAMGRFDRGAADVTENLEGFRISFTYRGEAPITFGTPEPLQIFGVELPSNFASLTSDIPLPVMPEPPDYSERVFNSSGPEQPRRRRS